MSPPPHRPQQARSRARRDQLLRAAASLLAEGGVKAVTHRSVAERAGVPVASTTYYFDSIDQLAAEALRLTTEERVDQLDAFVDLATESPPPAGEVGRRFLAEVVSRPTADIVAQLEVYLEAARNSEMQPTAQAAIEAFERVAQHALDRTGPRDDRGIAVAISALVDGFAIHRLVRPLPPERELEIMLLALRALFVAHTADDDELAGWPQRFYDRMVEASRASRASRDGNGDEPPPAADSDQPR
jgi:TetR/AcrR family transcriptional regulator, regulator of biofilm formation and stress response